MLPAASTENQKTLVPYGTVSVSPCVAVCRPPVASDC
jgi:hypothetical protein